MTVEKQVGRVLCVVFRVLESERWFVLHVFVGVVSATCEKKALQLCVHYAALREYEGGGFKGSA